MVTQELLQYVADLKQQGKSDDAIREILVSTGWPVEDINHVCAQINSQSSSQQPSLSNDQNDVSAEEKPKIIKAAATLVFSIGTLYTMGAISILGVILVMNMAMSNSYLAVSVLQYFPTTGVVPIVFSLVSLFFFYVAIKIGSGSKFSFLLALSSLVVVPVLVAFFSQALLSPFLGVLAGNTENSPVPTAVLELRHDLILILAIVCVILLLLSFKKFTFTNESISKKAKIFLGLVFGILVVPVISIVLLNFSNARETDYGFTKAKATVGHHIYKPAIIPSGFAYASTFVLEKELAGKQSAVQVVFDIPFDMLLKGEQSNPIVLSQVHVGAGFDLYSFATTYMEDADIQEMYLMNAADNEGYLLQRSIGDSTLSSILYLTQDNILISVISPKATSEELVALINSFE